MLAQWLYEYASFAVFVAEPMLRGEGGPPSSRRGDVPPLPLAKKIAELMQPLAPTK